LFVSSFCLFLVCFFFACDCECVDFIFAIVHELLLILLLLINFFFVVVTIACL
jgi:hypothetical protein